MTDRPTYAEVLAEPAGRRLDRWVHVLWHGADPAGFDAGWPGDGLAVSADDGLARRELQFAPHPSRVERFGPGVVDGVDSFWKAALILDGRVVDAVGLTPAVAIARCLVAAALAKGTCGA